MKNIVLVVSTLVMAGLLVLVVRFGEKANKAFKNLEEERYSRMVAEETLQKNSAKLTTLHSQLKDEQDKMAKIEDILDQEKSVNTDLKKQYDELAQAKADLESKLQAALQEKEKIAVQIKTAQELAAQNKAAQELAAQVQAAKAEVQAQVKPAQQALPAGSAAAGH